MNLRALTVIASGLIGVQTTELAADSLLPQEISVEDLVRFADIGDPLTLEDNDSRPGDVGLYSPNGQFVAVVVRQGNLDQQTSDAKLLVYRAAELLSNPNPVAVAEFASASNYQPIAYLRWLMDSETLLFAGTKDEQLSQVYRVNIHTRRLEQLTKVSTQLKEYDIDPFGRWLVTLSEQPIQLPAQNPTCYRTGCRMTNTLLANSERGIPSGSDLLSVYDLHASGEARMIESPEVRDERIKICFGLRVFSEGISPDGRFVLRLCEYERPLKEWWREYTADPRFRGCRQQWWRGCARQYVLTDLQSGSNVTVSDAPAMSSVPKPIWIDGGRSFILPGAVEPLNVMDAAEREHRAATLAILIVDSQTRKVTRIARLDRNIAKVSKADWSAQEHVLTVNVEDNHGTALPTMRFKREGRRWRDISRAKGTAPDKGLHQSVRLLIEQSLNDRPIIVAVNSRGERRAVLDPNPWLANRQLGHVEAITWKSMDGSDWQGGLYYPPQYVAGVQYPLVIQTHGFEADEFSLTGLSRNYAGRALAAHGMFVLQVEENYWDLVGTPKEYPTIQAGYEGAIEHLARQGIVDRNRVGIQGWSRTGPQMGYTLTHSSYSFAAGAFTETADFGWLWYVTSNTSSSMHLLYGAAPFGEGLKPWIEAAPTFNLDRVKTPMLMWGAGEAGGLVLWDWYALLTKLKKPVEYWTSQKTAHEVFKVGQRLFVNRLLVDWFRFWLKNEEDPDPAKAEQYVRWREFREQQSNEAAAVNRLSVR